VSVVACPQCGETDDLSGERVDGGVQVTCQACRYQWLRVPGASCDRCGGTDVWKGLRPLLERSRGTQLSITGTVDVTLCWQCDRQVLENHMERSGKSRIVMPDELPTTSGDTPRHQPRPGS
jgi:hypothetical protein